MKRNTKAIHTAYQKKDAYGSLAMPVYHVAAYEFDDAEVMSDVFCGRIEAPDYSRVTNPTVIYLEKKVRELTGAKAVTALNSGMAAISNVLIALSSMGKNVVSSRHLFGNTFNLLSVTLPKFGVEGRFCDLTDPEQVERKIDGDSCCIYLEIITNPQMEIADISALSQIARRHGIPLVADTTMIPFTRFSASSLGVDIEVVSSTKYISGGATSLGGLVIDYGKYPKFTEMMHGEMLLNFGTYMNPHAAYMQTLGLETLEARYDVHQANARKIAEALASVENIRRVNYPGLESNPYYQLAERQFDGSYGAMLTLDLNSKEKAFDFINRLRIVKRATNLFDNKSLAIHPASTIFGNFTEEAKREMDIYDTTVRISVGLEDPDDIIEDIVNAAK